MNHTMKDRDEKKEPNPAKQRKTHNHMQSCCEKMYENNKRQRTLFSFTFFEKNIFSLFSSPVEGSSLYEFHRSFESSHGLWFSFFYIFFFCLFIGVRCIFFCAGINKNINNWRRRRERHEKLRHNCDMAKGQVTGENCTLMIINRIQKKQKVLFTVPSRRCHSHKTAKRTMQT